MSQLHVYQGDFETRRLAPREVLLGMTETRQTDVIGAVTRGLAEYLMQCELHNWCDGRAYAFRSAHDQAPETHDDRADMPSVLVSVGAADFVSGLSGGSVGAATLPDPSNKPQLEGVEMSLQMIIRVFAMSRQERSALLALVQDALTADPGQLHVRLLLPYYHGSYAIYALERIENLNDGAEKKIWSADVRVNVSTALVRLYMPEDAPPTQVFHSATVEVGVAPFPIIRPLSPLHDVRVLGAAAAAQTVVGPNS